MDGMQLGPFTWVTWTNLLLKMFHVWDHLDFTQDVAWFKSQGWPLLKVRYLFFSPIAPPKTSKVSIERCAIPSAEARPRRPV